MNGTGRSADGRPSLPRPLLALCLLSFFLADVRDGLGPFLATHLQTAGTAQWLIGATMAAGGLAAVAMTPVAGAWVDGSSRKRGLLVGSVALVLGGSALAFTGGSATLLVASQVVTGVGGALMAAAIAGLTLGIARRDGFKAQVGRNEAWSHTGNVLAALASGLVAHRFGASWILAVMVVLAVGALLSVRLIRADDVDDAAARGCPEDAAAAAPDAACARPGADRPHWRRVLGNRPLLLFAAACAAFHLGNAAMLPLLNQRLAATVPDSAPLLWTSIAIVVAQLTMVPVALWVARSRRLPIEAFVYAAILVLPVRGVVAYAFTSAWGNVPVQILDGFAAGALGVATPLLVERYARATGAFNTSLGLVLTLQGIGAALSPLLANGTVGSAGHFGAGFVVLSLAALVALPLFWLATRAGGPAAAAPAPAGPRAAGAAPA